MSSRSSNGIVARTDSKTSNSSKARSWARACGWTIESSAFEQGTECRRGQLIGEAAVQIGGGLTENIDLLKMQVDGSQAGGIRDLSALLSKVESISVDYRSRVGEPQNLGLLFNVLEGAGFRTAVQGLDATRTQPLIAMPGGGSIDNHLRIIGFRT